MLSSESAFAKSPKLMNVLFISPGLGTEGVTLDFTAAQAPFGEWPGGCGACSALPKLGDAPCAGGGRRAALEGPQQHHKAAAQKRCAVVKAALG